MIYVTVVWYRSIGIGLWVIDCAPMLWVCCLGNDSHFIDCSICWRAIGARCQGIGDSMHERQRNACGGERQHERLGERQRCGIGQCERREAI